MHVGKPDGAEERWYSFLCKLCMSCIPLLEVNDGIYYTLAIQLLFVTVIISWHYHCEEIECGPKGAPSSEIESFAQVV